MPSAEKEFKNDFFSFLSIAAGQVHLGGTWAPTKTNFGFFQPSHPAAGEYLLSGRAVDQLRRCPWPLRFSVENLFFFSSRKFNQHLIHHVAHQPQGKFVVDSQFHWMRRTDEPRPSCWLPLIWLCSQLPGKVNCNEGTEHFSKNCPIYTSFYICHLWDNST